MEVIAALCRVGVEFFTSEIHRWLACFSADVMKVLENRFILYGVYSLARGEKVGGCNTFLGRQKIVFMNREIRWYYFSYSIYFTVINGATNYFEENCKIIVDKFTIYTTQFCTKILIKLSSSINFSIIILYHILFLIYSLLF